MITFLDERDVEHGALATIKVTNAVNGERSLTGEIESGDYVLANIERGWRLRFDDEFYVVTYAKPVDDGKGTHVTFDAVHQFFWDFDKSSVHDQLNDGSHTFLTYLDFIFTGSDYTYTIDPLLKVYAFEKQSFGYKSRLNLFNDIITASGVEFQVIGKVVRILEKTGTDLSTVVRKNFNMNELGIEKHIGDFVTYQKGFGAWVDENDHTKGRLVTEYTSPLASVYGKLEAEPLVDERYTQADNMIAALKANVDNSYSISVRLDMEDLTRAGYEYTQPRAGDYIMAINETLDFQEKIRIVSFTSEYDVTGQLIKHEVTCNDIGAVKKLSASYSLTKEQAQSASATVVKAVEMANKALISADGKSTVYFGTEFPEDEPKGELHKGDSLYLTVGDTTKMYYWTGADWEELPIVNDVEAFKEQIADELKDVPNREEFEATITEKLATSKAEIKTQIDTAKTQAESNAKAYADEINQATAEVAEQANAAADALKTDLTKVKTDLTATTSTANSAETSASEAKQQITTVANNLSKAKTDLTDSIAAVNNKADTIQSNVSKAQSDIATVSGNLTKAKQDLQTSINSVDSKADGIQSNLTKAKTELNTAIAAVNTKATNLQTDVSNLNTSLSNTSKTVQSHVTALANQAKELQDQADQLTAQAEAQDVLATRVETVETTANGTKSTVSELSKTVASNTNNITSVTNRTKTVETDLTSAKTSISELQTNLSSTQTGLTNLTKRTKDVEDDLSGTKTTLTELSQTVADDGETITGLTTKTATIESSVNGLKTSLTNTEKDLTSVTTRTKNVENDLAGTKTSLTSLSQTVAADGQTITSLSNKTKTIESNVDGLTTSLSNTQKDLTSVTNRTKTVEDTLDGTRTELAELQETVDTTNSNLASVTERTSTVESDLSGTKTSLSNLTKTVSDDGKTIASLSSQTKTIESTVSGLKTSLTSTQSDLAGITTRTKNVEDDLSGTKTELAELQTTVGTTNTDLANVTKRTKTVEDDLAGTKTSLSSLSQTVDNDGKNITSLTSRTKTVEDSVSGLTTTMTSVQQTLTSTTNRTKAVEDDLANTKTTLSATTTTANSTSQKTATLETGLNGLNAKFDSLSVGNKNYLPASRVVNRGCSNFKYNESSKSWTMTVPAGATGFGKGITFNIANLDVRLFSEETLYFGMLIKADKACKFVYDINNWLSPSGSNSNDNDDRSKAKNSNLNIPAGAWTKVWFSYTAKPNTVIVDSNSTCGITDNKEDVNLEIKDIMVAKSNVPIDYQMPDADIEQKVAEYKQTADQNYASLQTTVQNLDGTVKANKTTADQTAQGFSARIESLETYKDGETTRASQYFESAKTETARQLTAERTVIAKDYVAKSTYTSDVTGIRNDLTATTTTANTTKTNLANYQASNDKAVANLQSNLQTANGNISSLQTKVEAVPGQITSAVSSVEGKIPTSLDSLNLMTGTRDWSTKINKWHMGANWSTESDEYQGLKVHSTQKGYNGSHQNIFVKNGDIVTFSFFAKATNTLSKIKVSSRCPDSSVYQAPLAGVKESDEQITITSEWKRYSKTVHIISDGSLQFRTEYDGSTIPDGNTFYIAGLKLAKSALDTGYSENPTDAASDISKLNTALTQTANGLEQLSTQVTSQGNTITSHTNSINSLTTGLSAKVSQSDFNTLSGRVTTAENNITAKANELSSKISSVEGQIPSGEMNLVEYGRPADGYSPYNYAEYATHSFYYNSAYKMYIIKNTATSEKTFGMNRFKVERNTDYTLYFKGFNNSAITHMDVWFLKRVNGSTKDFDSAQILVSGRKLSVSKAEDVSVTFNTGNYDEGFIRFDNNGSTTAGTQADLYFGDVSVKKGKSNNGWSPSLAELASSQDLKSAQSEIKQTTNSITASVSSLQTAASNAQSTANTAVSKADAAQAGVNTLDSTTVKSASLTINTDGIVMKAGKSTTDVANAIGSYFAVNQNAINLFSDKINVKGSMIVDGAITSDKIASKQINTAHFNGKIITADVIATGAITADAIKAGAVTTDKMTANSINGDRITAGTLDAAKIKAGSITASQIASGTITSSQIATGTISAANIAAGTITGDNIKANSVDVSKISGLSAEYLKAKIENAMIDWMKGKTIIAYNGNMAIDLQNGRISFKDGSNAIYRQTDDGIHTGFLHFEAGSQGGIYAAFGATSTRQGINSKSSEFAGIRCYRVSADGDSHDAKIDKIEVIGDTIQFGHGYRSDGQIGGGFIMDTAVFGNDTPYSLNRVIKSIEALWRILHDHAKNTGYRFNDSAFIGALNNEYNVWHDMHNI